MGTLTARICVVALVLLTSSSTALAQSQSLFFRPPLYPGADVPVVTADFNGDGKPDLVNLNGAVLLGKGDGTFTVGTPLSFGIAATGDFNGDGKPDLLAFSGTSINVLLGKRDGTFQPAVSTNVGTPLGPVVVVDVNKDGKADIVGLGSGLVFVFVGKGDGTFAPAVTYPQISNFSRVLAVGDFNGDGKVDIVMAVDSVTNAMGTTPGAVGVLLGNGDGTFQPPIMSIGVNAPTYIVAADFNGDGKLDLAICDSGFLGAGTFQTFTLLGNGNGTFQAPSSPVPAIGTLVSADLNGDGKPDLIVANSVVGIFLNNGNGTFTLHDSYFQYGEGGINNTLFFPAIAIADFNGDGKTDIAANGTMLLGNGDGSFQGNPAAVPDNPRVRLLGLAASGDFNGDGIPDIAITSANHLLYILLADTTGKLSRAQTYSLPLPIDAITTADLNGDGKLDLVFTTHEPIGSNWILNVMLGNGDGSFGSPTALPQGVPGLLTSIAVADLNGDHKPDLLVISNGELAVFLGKGDGTFDPPVSYFAGSSPTSFVTADLNGDGKIDVAVASSTPSSAGLGVLLGKGDGTFQPATFSNSQVIGLSAAADLNGDGVPDLVATSRPSNGNHYLQVLLGNGDGTFNGLALMNPENDVNIADVNGDGRLDLLSSGSDVHVLLGNGDGTFGNPIQILPGLGPSFFAYTITVVADFNRDKRPDLAVGFSTAANDVVMTLLNIAGPPAPDFLISASVLSPATLAPGSPATSTVTVTSVAGFSGAVALSCTGLPSGANCGFSPSSLPSASGTASLTISTAASTPLGTYPVLIVGTSGALTHQQVVTLTVGTSAGATTASLVPQTLTFAQQAAGTTSGLQNVTLTNTGSAPIVISGIAVTGANKGDFAQTNDCLPLLPPSANCDIKVTFTPTGMGARGAAISVSDNATGSPQMVALAGTGPDFSVGASGVASATVTAGHTASYTISLAPGGGFNQTVTLTCTGAPAMSTCTVSPTSASLSGSSAVTATVTVATTAHGLLLPMGVANLRTNHRLAPLLLAVLAVMMMAVALHLLRRNMRFRWVPVFTLLILLCLGMTLTSCGGGGSGSPGGGGGGGTQAGTYTLTVSASATSGSTTLTHSTNLTLVVQ